MLIASLLTKQKIKTKFEKLLQNLIAPGKLKNAINATYIRCINVRTTECIFYRKSIISSFDKIIYSLHSFSRNRKKVTSSNVVCWVERK